MLGMKHRILIIEVIVCPRADGGCPSDGHRNMCLLTKAKHTELVGDKV